MSAAPSWTSVPGADGEAPEIGLVAAPTLQRGVFRRVLAGTHQIYICLGTIDHFSRKVAHLPAGLGQPLGVQVAVLEGYPVNEVVVSDGTCPLWSDDVVIYPYHDEPQVLISVSSAGEGERPTELPAMAAIVPDGGAGSASDQSNSAMCCAAAPRCLACLAGGGATTRRRRTP